MHQNRSSEAFFTDAKMSRLGIFYDCSNAHGLGHTAAEFIAELTSAGF
jgi:hypothetical protein